MICVDRLESFVFEGNGSQAICPRDGKSFDKYKYIFRGGAVICLIYIGVV